MINLLLSLPKDKPLYSLTIGEFQSLMEQLIPTVTPQTVTPPIEDENLTIKELAIKLKKTEGTIHRYKKNGSIPFYKVSRTVFFKLSEVEAALTSQPKKKGNKV